MPRSRPPVTAPLARALALVLAAAPVAASPSPPPGERAGERGGRTSVTDTASADPACDASPCAPAIRAVTDSGMAAVGAVTDTGRAPPPDPLSGGPVERGCRDVLLTGLDADADLLRLAGLSGTAPQGSEFLRRAGARTARVCDGEPVGWTARLRPAPEGRLALAALPARLDGVWSARFPEAANDGLLWQGRGFGARASAGVYARAGVLSAALAPELAWQQNAWFEAVPTGRPGQPFASPWYPGSWGVPQRFGAGPFWSASPGQSYVRVDAYGAAAGLSTENLWLGPGARTALLLTDAGPGFPHAFLGTSAPVDFGIGGVEALALWGRLDRTRFASDDPGHRWFSALALGWEPRWTPGLHVGAARAFVETWASLERNAYLSILETPWKSPVAASNPQDNQLAALWFRWVLPESALELYGEWAKDDFPASFGALLREPERTQAWLLGVQKLARVAGRRVRVQVEAAKIGGGGYPDYVHGGGLDWTNRGQPLGSYAGPGGILTFAAVDVLAPWGRVGGFVERLERNATVFDERFAPLPDRRTDRDAEVTAGLRGVLLAGPAEVTWEAAGGYRWNRDFGRNEPAARVSLSFAAPTRGRASR